MLKLNQTAYVLRYWQSVEAVVIMEIKITGIKIVDKINIMYFVENSEYQAWINDTKVYLTIDEVIENLRDRVIK